MKQSRLAMHPAATAAPAEEAPKSIVSRLLSLRVAAMLGRNTAISCLVFAFDLLLLWLFVERLAMDELVAATIAFLLAATVHYGFCRTWIFRGTERALGPGYVYFLINAGVGLVLTILLFWVLMMAMHYLVARVVASVFAGLAVFLLNAVLNFRSV